MTVITISPAPEALPKFGVNEPLAVPWMFVVKALTTPSPMNETVSPCTAAKSPETSALYGTVHVMVFALVQTFVFFSGSGETRMKALIGSMLNTVTWQTSDGA